jgi:hypothetical protein
MRASDGIRSWGRLPVATPRDGGLNAGNRWPVVAVLAVLHGIELIALVGAAVITRAWHGRIPVAVLGCRRYW